MALACCNPVKACSTALYCYIQDLVDMALERSGSMALYCCTVESLGNRFLRDWELEP